MTFPIPRALLPGQNTTPEQRDWLHRLPDIIAACQAKWSLEIGEPFDGPDVSAAWVAPVVCENARKAVLKVGRPHMEAYQEAAGLRFWSGNPTVALLGEDRSTGAMLLERCEPGTSLRRLNEKDQDVVIAGLLPRLWRQPDNLQGFRPLSVMLESWAEETRRCRSHWRAPALVEEGLELFAYLSRPSPSDVLLATDLHAGNVLEAGREPWLVIDPKPFIGDPAYDVTQHLLNCKPRLTAEPSEAIRRMSELVNVDPERIRLWLFARAAAEPRDIWDDDAVILAHALS